MLLSPSTARVYENCHRYWYTMQDPRFLRAFHSGSRSQFRLDGSLSDSLVCSSGVRQGCVAAPSLIDIAINYWMNRVSERTPNLGASYHCLLTDLCYADDEVVFLS